MTIAPPHGEHPAGPHPTAPHTIREEIANALTHGLGATAALAAGAVMITLAAIHGDGWQLAGAIVFGIALLLLYLGRSWPGR